MKILMKSGLTLGILLFFTATAWSMPMVGDKVDMNTGWGNYYGMKILDSANNNSIDSVFNTFCLEKNEYFANPGTNATYDGPYRVDSVGSVAYDGGNSGAVDFDNDGTLDGDPISEASLWLYASYFEGALGNASALDVQNAIWFAEGEITNDSYYNSLVGSEQEFKVAGWNIQVVNIVDWTTGAVRQSQLVGEIAPVPEPATMMLFGFGLLGLAGIGRKKLS